MIEPSSITDKAHGYIKKRLNALAKEHNIRILFAIESGSRAWGFPSQNSDYDVRFIYARSLNDYLSVAPFRDVIETPLMDDPTLGVPFDINGWDIKKALLLAAKSNAVLIEWLTSPVRYMEEPSTIAELHQFATSCAVLPSIMYHYDRLARSIWDQIKESDSDPKLKAYCYVLRPSLVLEWIRQFNITAPMDIYSLCNRLPLTQDFLAQIKHLIDRKAIADETHLTPKIGALDQFITNVLEKKVEKQMNIWHTQERIKMANHLFLKFVNAPQI